MTFSTTFGSFVGSNAGKASAYAKHAVLASGVHTANVAVAARAAYVESYAAKDAELAARREELNAARISRGALTPPVRKSQRKLAV